MKKSGGKEISGEIEVVMGEVSTRGGEARPQRGAVSPPPKWGAVQGRVSLPGSRNKSQHLPDRHLGCPDSGPRALLLGVHQAPGVGMLEAIWPMPGFLRQGPWNEGSEQRNSGPETWALLQAEPLPVRSHQGHLPTAESRISRLPLTPSRPPGSLPGRW